MDPVEPKRRGRKLFGTRHKDEAPSEAEMEQEPTPPPSGTEPNPRPPGRSRLGRMYGGTVDPTIVPARPDQLGGKARPMAAAAGATAESMAAGDADADGSSTPTPETRPTDPDPEITTMDTNVAAVDDTTKDPASEDAPEAPAATPDEISIQSRDTPPAAEADVASSESEPEPHQPVIPSELPRIIAIANQKGGVGKTTTSVNLGASLAEAGFRVLVVDLDPQGNATTGLGVNARELVTSIYDVIMSDAAVEDCVEPTSLKNLFVAPATIDLAGAEIELVPAFSRELKLRRALHEIRDEYDYILIDCPPSLGLLTVNGLAAADDVLVPIQCEYYALEGLSQLIRNVALVRTNLNPTLDVRGIVLTMYDARTKLADQVEQEVRSHFGRTVYLTVIPRTVRLSEAPSFGQPIILFDPTSRGAVAYRELAKEVSHGATRRTG